LIARSLVGGSSVAIPWLCLTATCLIMLPLGRPLVTWLQRHGIGKHIREDGPSSHQSKAGTPTMGGIYFVGGTAIACAIAALTGRWLCLLPTLAMVGFAALGAYDDLQGLQDAKGVGWLARRKFVAQWGMALLLSLALYWLSDDHTLVIPLSTSVVRIGFWFVPMLTLWLVGSANAVNLTDGLDGLAGGASAIGMLAMLVILLWRGEIELAIFAAIYCGAVAAFLWFNVNPARMFMGDLGSQALGAGLAAIAALSGLWLVLPVVGLVFVAEAVSVMVQVSYFKYSKRRFGEGKRILRMAPLHHHFELIGWSEGQIVSRLWLVALLAGSLGIAGVVQW